MFLVKIYGIGFYGMGPSFFADIQNKVEETVASALSGERTVVVFPVDARDLERSKRVQDKDVVAEIDYPPGISKEALERIEDVVEGALREALPGAKSVGVLLRRLSRADESAWSE